MKKLFFILFFGIAAFAGCRTYPTVYNIEHQAVTANNKQIVEDAIISGGTKSGWQITKVGEGLMRGTFSYSNHKMVVDIPYTERNYSIIYRDSENLRYNEKKNTIHPRYNKWVIRLSRCINNAITNSL